MATSIIIRKPNFHYKKSSLSVYIVLFSEFICMGKNNHRSRYKLRSNATNVDPL